MTCVAFDADRKELVGAYGPHFQSAISIQQFQHESLLLLLMRDGAEPGDPCDGLAVVRVWVVRRI